MKTFTKVVLALSLLTPASSFAKEQWFCTDDQAMRSGNTLQICGVGTAVYEGPAREKALQTALNEFRDICELSSDCKGQKVTVEPKRSTCFQGRGSWGSGVFTCHRLFVFTVGR